MRPVPDQPNVVLRPDGAGGRVVVLAFPYDAVLVSAVRALPGRRFDWDAREWVAPADDWVSVKLRKILHLYPELTCSREVDAWLTAASERWIGHVRTSVYDGRGWWALDTLAGSPPPGLRESIVEHDGRALVPMTAQAAGVLAEMEPGRLSVAAARCLEYVERGEAPPPARLTFGSGVAGPRFSLEVLWDHDVAAAFERLPGAVRNELKLDPWIADQLDGFVALHQVELTPAAGDQLGALVAEHRAARTAVAASRAREADPIDEVAGRLGGELAPFQWAAVRYALGARRCFLSDEQGLGKTVEALAVLEADDAFPAVVVSPASMKLTWAREAARRSGPT